MWIKDFIKKHPYAQHTGSEIMHQPALWMKIWENVVSQKDVIQDFVGSATSESDSIVLTGAGTSAYIGITVQRVFRKKYNLCSEPISTTHIVSHPKDFLISSRNVLMVSFARSGNSPESCAAADLVGQASSSAKHLIITCNKEGQLSKKYSNDPNAFVFVLPEEANDKSLAMTSSYTGMMLAAILIARIDEIESLEPSIIKLMAYGQRALDESQYICKIAQKDFNRAVFLGAGPLYGVAKEAQLKMQELTDGLVIGKHDSYLGLRHGPKAVIDDKTLVVHHMSNNAHSIKYDIDLIASMRKDSRPMGQLIIGEDIMCQEYVDWSINFDSNGNPIDEDLLSVASIVPSQLLSTLKSIQLGLTPDNPSRNGAISRVVKGVSIYQS